jgi:hypothetical protein
VGDEKMKVNGKEYFSVSQLDLFKSCPRGWYLLKRKGYKEVKEDSPYLIRGSLVHDVLQFNDKNFVKHMEKHKDYMRLNNKFQNETKSLFKMIEHENQLPSKPIHKELCIINDDLEMVAYLDVVGDDYIVDYKTSRFFREVSDNYIWQLRIYAMLYYYKFNKFIKNIGVYYLKYGKIHWFRLKESDMPKIRKIVEETIEYIKELEKDESNFKKCTYCGPYECLCKRLIK